MKKKVMCVLGTRPEAVKMSPVIKSLKTLKNLETIVVTTAQHREMLDQMLAWFEIKPDYDLNLMQHGQSLTDLTAKVLKAMDKLYLQHKPDLILVQGDTVTVMAASLAAFFHKIPVGHVEAGLRTHDKYNPFPEEMSRRQTARIASLHFAPTQLAVSNLANEGIVENVFLTGNTVVDALIDTAERLQKIQLDLSVFGKANFKDYRVILVTAHRRENWGDSMINIANALKAIVEKFNDVQILFPVHKNPIIREAIEGILNSHNRIVWVEPLDYVPFVYAMQNCYLILTDSGGIQEEAPSFSKPCLVLRTNTERPEAIDAGTSILVGVETENIIDKVSSLINNPQIYVNMSSKLNPFGDGQASQKIAQIVQDFLL